MGTAPFFGTGDPRNAPLSNNLERSMAGEALADTRRTRSRLDELERRLDRMALVAEALWRTLRDRFGLEEEELFRLAQDLDLSDGLLDGKMRVPSAPCASCGRVISHRHVRCIWCGVVVPRPPFAGL